MPVYSCAGPACQRLISISAIPGGNPMALADPEGYAIHYLKCQGCQKHFCDRCLGKLGRGMSETACPACKGALFNPNVAATPAPSPSPSPPKEELPLYLGINSGTKSWLVLAANGDLLMDYADSLGGSQRRVTAVRRADAREDLTVVQLRGDTLNMPAGCACCVRVSDVERHLSERREVSRSGNTIQYAVRKIEYPYCNACSLHLNTGELFEAGTALLAARRSGSPALPLLAGLVVAALLFFGAFGMNLPGSTGFHMDMMQRGGKVRLGGLVSLLVGGAVAGGLLVLSTRRRAARIAAATDAEARARAKAASHASPTCCRLDNDPVQYFWDGKDQHIFVLFSQRFAKTFLQLNRAALVTVNGGPPPAR